jgi:hypothetical protein
MLACWIGWPGRETYDDATPSASNAAVPISDRMPAHLVPSPVITPLVVGHEGVRAACFSAGNSIPARGRQVRIGWFRHTDPRMITLIFSAGEPVVLLVIPPDTAAGPAEATLKLTTQDTAGLSIDDILTGARLPPNPTPPHSASARDGSDGSARWDNEGGSITGREPPPSTRRPSASA